MTKAQDVESLANDKSLPLLLQDKTRGYSLSFLISIINVDFPQIFGEPFGDYAERQLQFIN